MLKLHYTHTHTFTCTYTYTYTYMYTYVHTYALNAAKARSMVARAYFFFRRVCMSEYKCACMRCVGRPWPRKGAPHKRFSRCSVRAYSRTGLHHCLMPPLRNISSIYISAGVFFSPILSWIFIHFWTLFIEWYCYLKYAFVKNLIISDFFCFLHTHRYAKNEWLNEKYSRKEREMERKRVRVLETEIDVNK